MPPPMAIVMADLPPQEKDKMMRFLMEHKVQFSFNSRTSRYTAHVQVLAPGSQVEDSDSDSDSAAKARVGKSITARTRISGSRHHKKVQRSPRTVEVDTSSPIVKTPVRARAFEESLRKRYAGFCSFLKPLGGWPKDMTLIDVRKFIEMVYADKYAIESHRLKLESEVEAGLAKDCGFRLRNAVGEAASSPFPRIAADLARKHTGVSRVLTQRCWTIANGVDAYRADHDDVELFGRFLDETFDAIDLLFFLIVRDDMRSKLSHQATGRRWKVVGQGQPNLVLQAPGAVAPILMDPAVEQRQRAIGVRTQGLAPLPNEAEVMVDAPAAIAIVRSSVTDRLQDRILQDLDEAFLLHTQVAPEAQATLPFNRFLLAVMDSYHATRVEGGNGLPPVQSAAAATDSSLEPRSLFDSDGAGEALDGGAASTDRPDSGDGDDGGGGSDVEVETLPPFSPADPSILAAAVDHSETSGFLGGTFDLTATVDDLGANSAFAASSSGKFGFSALRGADAVSDRDRASTGSVGGSADAGRVGESLGGGGGRGEDEVAATSSCPRSTSPHRSSSRFAVDAGGAADAADAADTACAADGAASVGKRSSRSPRRTLSDRDCGEVAVTSWRSRSASPHRPSSPFAANDGVAKDIDSRRSSRSPRRTLSDRQRGEAAATSRSRSASPHRPSSPFAANDGAAKDIDSRRSSRSPRRTLSDRQRGEVAATSSHPRSASRSTSPHRPSSPVAVDDGAADEGAAHADGAANDVGRNKSSDSPRRTLSDRQQREASDDASAAQTPSQSLDRRNSPSADSAGRAFVGSTEVADSIGQQASEEVVDRSASAVEPAKSRASSAGGSGEIGGEGGAVTAASSEAGAGRTAAAASVSLVEEPLAPVATALLPGAASDARLDADVSPAAPQSVAETGAAAAEEVPRVQATSSKITTSAVPDDLGPAFAPAPALGAAQFEVAAAESPVAAEPSGGEAGQRRTPSASSSRGASRGRQGEPELDGASGSAAASSASSPGRRRSATAPPMSLSEAEAGLAKDEAKEDPVDRSATFHGDLAAVHDEGESRGEEGPAVSVGDSLAATSEKVRTKSSSPSPSGRLETPSALGSSQEIRKTASSRSVSRGRNLAKPRLDPGRFTSQNSATSSIGSGGGGGSVAGGAQGPNLRSHSSEAPRSSKRSGVSPSPKASGGGAIGGLGSSGSMKHSQSWRAPPSPRGQPKSSQKAEPKVPESRVPDYDDVMRQMSEMGARADAIQDDEIQNVEDAFMTGAASEDPDSFGTFDTF